MPLGSSSAAPVMRPGPRRWANPGRGAAGGMGPALYGREMTSRSQVGCQNARSPTTSRAGVLSMSATFKSRMLARNHVNVQGEGTRPLVFAHGFGCDQNMWRFVEPAFRGRFRTVLFDYVGLGRSDRAAFDPNRYSTLDGYAQDLLD